MLGNERSIFKWGAHLLRPMVQRESHCGQQLSPVAPWNDVVRAVLQGSPPNYLIEAWRCQDYRWPALANRQSQKTEFPTDDCCTAVIDDNRRGAAREHILSAFDRFCPLQTPELVIGRV